MSPTMEAVASPHPSLSTGSPTFIAWNNRGVECMQHGRHRAAIDAFSQALLILRNSIKRIPNNGLAGAVDSHVAVDVSPFVAVARPAAISTAAGEAAVGEAAAAAREESTSTSASDNVTASSDDGAKTAQEQQQDDPSPSRAVAANNGNERTKDEADEETRLIEYVYDQTVAFSPALQCPETYASRPILRALSVLVIFNLGLAHHFFARTLTSVASPASIKKVIARTIRLYEMALKSQRACLQSMGVDGFVLLVALHNNLGRAQHLAGDIPKAEACWRTLLSLLLWSTQQRNPSSSSSSSSNSHIIVHEGFWHSVSHLLLPNPAPAAAA